MQCTNNVTLWRVRVTILQWKHNNVFCVFRFVDYTKIFCCKTTLSW